ncbi:hypothetical protein FHS81_003345 [Pseudochelatococcus contaminans]|uniref:Uncharacterized protein n=1 Tax=Pseudochelatococcus contaminans TaxID=1538103 RepID=A0A7W5Z866_9HYPH|nr:hypothetical protein [Pseudochelatococcus contaminans]
MMKRGSGEAGRLPRPIVCVLTLVVGYPACEIAIEGRNGFSRADLNERTSAMARRMTGVCFSGASSAMPVSVGSSILMESRSA